MTRVDFYVLPDQKDNGRVLLACRLIDKAYHLGHTLYVLAASEAQAAALDDLLWTFRQDSFIPHERYPLTGEDDSPILIGTRLAPDRHAQVLINFSNELPEDFARFERVVELVDQSPEVLAKSRERFRRYREHGLTPETHKL
ncbi:MAG: DNA polymerase III subunit chi [Candidatus Competibacter denitrificans]